MNSFDNHSTRSNYYLSLIEILGKQAFKIIDENGKSLLAPQHGPVWVGTIIYVIGELKRTQKIDICNYHNKNLLVLAIKLLKTWQAESEIDSCFTALGLSAWGELNQQHPIFKELNQDEQNKLKLNLKVTREFKNNWEAFNSCIEGANKILQPNKPNTIETHIHKILNKYSETGYHDDSDNLGVYDSYGLMSLNYCLKALEIQKNDDFDKKNLLPLFTQHCLRYFALIKAMIYPDGSGWPFGRSVGVLGQLQYIVFLEQCLFHNIIKGNDAEWARGAIRACLNRMVDLFWDPDFNWFCFRDAHHTCYSYRNTLPMHFDILRYFLQTYEYSKFDENKIDNIEKTFSPESKCIEIITDPKRKTSIFVWSDSTTQFVIPIIGCSMKKLTSDNAAKPHCRGIIEGVTEDLKPIWVPSLRIKETDYYPANHFSKSEIIRNINQDIYRVNFNKLNSTPKNESGLDYITTVSEYIFSNRKFERFDTFTFHSDTTIEKYEMQILQSAAHPKRISGYGNVYQISPILKCENKQISLGDKIEIGDDPTYRNFFGKPSHKWSVIGHNLNFKAGDILKVSVSISW